MTVEPLYKFETVMVIDDNIIDLYITSRIITKSHFGSIILEYNLPHEALQFLKDNQENITALPELIFVDIYMPLMTGFEFMEEYDKLSDTLKDYCSVIIISSTSDDRDITRALRDKNVLEFQEKPLSKKFLKTINAKEIIVKK
jgi:CheY-like chemotaxis protein